MKIFLSFLQSKVQHRIAAYSFWEYYIKNGIEEAGYQWIESQDVDWAKGLIPQSGIELDRWRSESWEKTIDLLKKNPVDLFLSYLYPEQIDQTAVLEIRKMGIYCVNFFCDNVRQFKKIPSAFSRFDLNWVPEYKALSMYKEADFPYVNLPMPMWVEPKYRIPSTFERESVAFIGSKDLQRHMFFEELIRKNGSLNFEIYGSGWKAEKKENLSQVKGSILQRLKNQGDFIFKYGIKAYFNKINQINYDNNLSEQLQAIIKNKPSFDDYIKITRETKITIGINRYPSFEYPLTHPNTYSRLRDIEAPMLGACYLTEYTAGLDKLYDIGTEIEIFSSTDELLEKIKELESNHNKRKSLRIKGQLRALNQNSIIHSLKIIQQQLKN